MQGREASCSGWIWLTSANNFYSKLCRTSSEGAGLQLGGSVGCIASVQQMDSFGFIGKSFRDWEAVNVYGPFPHFLTFGLPQCT